LDKGEYIMATKKKVKVVEVDVLRDTLATCLELAEKQREAELVLLVAREEVKSRAVFYTCGHNGTLDQQDVRVPLAKAHYRNGEYLEYDSVRCPVCNPGYVEVQLQEVENG
jgi:hypothetical protein